MSDTIKIKDNRSTYPGGKGGSGVYQKIINLIPPHDIYIETHLGSGAILRNKKQASVNIGIDIDPAVTNAWAGTRQDLTIINEDASGWLRQYQFTGREFVYADPPYLMETRKGGKLYNFEYTTEDHVGLIEILKGLPCNVMISGYWSELYGRLLSKWNSISFEAQTRGGPATEFLWFNYPEPTVLHDYSFLGDDFKKRERIRKKKDRWVSRLLQMPDLERNAIVESILEYMRDPASSENRMKAL
jgi:site-specific DNA-adenine methylase